MDGKYISQTIIIIVIFSLLQMSNVLSVGIKNIQDNWSLYRCNPLIIPMAGLFGHDPQETFQYCSQNYNMNFGQYILDPFKYIINNIGSMGQNISQDVAGVINLGSSTNTGVFSIVTNIYGTATNALVAFQAILQGLRDTFAKIIGTLITFLYLLKGIEVIVPSALLTPPGEAITWILNTLGSTACGFFMPNCGGGSSNGNNNGSNNGSNNGNTNTTNTTNN